MLRRLRLLSICAVFLAALACNLSRAAAPTAGTTPIDPDLAQTLIAGTEAAASLTALGPLPPAAGETATNSPAVAPAATDTGTATPTLTPTATRTATPTSTLTSTATITLTSTKTPIPFSLKTITGSMSIDPGTISVARANCPDQTVVIGGGFSTKPQMAVLSNFINDNTWFAHAKNTFLENQDLTVFAYCVDHRLGETDQVSAVITLPKFGSGQITAFCPAGTLVTGGGFEAEGEELEVVSASYPIASGWQTRAQNLYDYQNKLSANAICLSGGHDRTAIVSARFSVPPGNTGGGKAVCPANSVSISGGFDLEADLYIYRSSQSSKTEWEADAINRGVQNRTITVYAVCLIGS